MQKCGEVKLYNKKGKWSYFAYMEGIIDVEGKRYKIVIMPNQFNPDADFEIFIKPEDVQPKD